VGIWFFIRVKKTPQSRLQIGQAPLVGGFPDEIIGTEVYLENTAILSGVDNGER
jgi:hypothetical protein